MIYFAISEVPNANPSVISTGSNSIVVKSQSTNLHFMCKYCQHIRIFDSDIVVNNCTIFGTTQKSPVLSVLYTPYSGWMNPETTNYFEFFHVNQLCLSFLISNGQQWSWFIEFYTAELLEWRAKNLPTHISSIDVCSWLESKSKQTIVGPVQAVVVIVVNDSRCL